jgi:uncharacterized membrane protein YqaE (UPF0057 family)
MSDEGVAYGERYDYSKTPAYRRKLKREKLRAAEKAGKLEMQGPLSIVIIAIIDLAITMAGNLISLIMDFSSSGFSFIYDMVYDTGTDLIPNSEKFGQSLSMKPMRVIVTVLIPPLGIFLSKGLMGWFNILLCFVLMYINFFLGVIYALVVTYRNRYADRYELAEQNRIFMIKEYVRSCTGEADKITELDTGDWKSIIYVCIFFLCFCGLLMWALRSM